ncbi:MAG: RNA-directed DNA polymerase [Ignavibacteriaceae bacterium]|jgi:hypothetical protein
MNITKKDLEVAYRKLKSFIYYDNTLLNVRIKLAEFEAEGLAKNLDVFFSKLKSYYRNENTLDDLLNKISFSLSPKQFEEVKESGNCYTNQMTSEDYIIKRISVFIDCSIEIYLISILWIMKVGYFLDKKIGSLCYANRVDPNDDYETWQFSSKLFNIYFYKYSEWRDNAIGKAKELHLDNDCVLITLDIKDYFNSIDFKINDISPHVEFEWLNKLLSTIHQNYAQKLLNKKLIKSERNILPIGLMSSYILANYYLSEYDEYLSKEFRPAYYGRYVDDIIIVFNHLSPEPADSEKYLKEYLFDAGKWYSENVTTDFSVTEGNNSEKITEYQIIINQNKLIIQDEKVKVFYFSKNHSINLLNEFEKEIKKNSSEFRLEPVEENVFSNFETSSYRISYSDTINKLRSINGFSTNKLGASKHLSKIIEVAKYAKDIDPKKIDSMNDQIADYFSGIRSLEFSSLWEKILTFFILSKSENYLIDFAREQLKGIDKIKLSEDIVPDSVLLSEYTDNIHSRLVQQLLFSFSMAVSLNVAFFNRRVVKKIQITFRDNLDNYLNISVFPQIIKHAKDLIQSNLLRHQYCFFPLLNYCKQPQSFSFINEKIAKLTGFDIDKDKLKYSPRFIPLHEFIQFHYLKAWHTSRRGSFLTTDPLAYCIKEFNKFTSKYYSREYKSDLKIEKRGKKFQTIIVDSMHPINPLKIGLVNIEINKENSIASFKNKPNLSFERLNDINKILNFGLRTGCDLIIFPEMSIPLQWLDNLLRYSRINQKGIVCGLEHFSNAKKDVFNYIATILPFEKKINEKHIYKNALLDLRLKKDYSPEEKSSIKKAEYQIPSFLKKEYLRLYNWRSSFFSSLNCFELTDLDKRILFKGKVDFLTVIEYNQDTNYFSSIIESIARDIHAYIVQVNSSNYGDSRITLPAETYHRDQAKIKGGKDVTIITGIIDIKALREFQLNPEKTKIKVEEKAKDKNKIMFKALPANFVISTQRKK